MWSFTSVWVIQRRQIRNSQRFKKCALWLFYRTSLCWKDIRSLIRNMKVSSILVHWGPALQKLFISAIDRVLESVNRSFQCFDRSQRSNHLDFNRTSQDFGNRQDAQIKKHSKFFITKTTKTKLKKNGMLQNFSKTLRVARNLKTTTRIEYT